MKSLIQRADRSGLYENQTFLQLKETISANLKRLRIEFQWTQETTAHECGLGVRLYQSIEACEANLTLLTVARLAEGLKIPVSELLDPTPQKKKKKQ